MDTLHDVLHTIINHFIPHEGNDYKPHLLQKTAVVTMCLLALLSFLIANFQTVLWQSSDWLVGAVLPAVVVDLTNTERAQSSLPELVRSSVLDRAAELKAQDMAANSYFSHESPTGVTPWHWFSEAKYPFVHAGENLAVYFTDSRDVVEAWMQSPTHRANIVGSQYREIGVGTAKGTYEGFDTVFVVQLFGTPALPPENKVVDKSVDVDEIVKLTDESEIVVSTTEVDATASTSSLVKFNQASSTPEVLGVDISTTTNSTTTVIATTNTDSEVMSEEVAPAPVANNNQVAIADVVSISSEMVSSSTNLEPAPLSAPVESPDIAPVAVLATQPHTVLQWIYIVLGSLTSIALLASVVIARHQHRPLQTLYGVLLLLLLCVLFYIHSIVMTSSTVL